MQNSQKANAEMPIEKVFGVCYRLLISAKAMFGKYISSRNFMILEYARSFTAVCVAADTRVGPVFTVMVSKGDMR